MSFRSRQSSGFTLVEILVAVAVFALLGVASSVTVQQMIRTKEQSAEKLEQLQELQRAMLIMEQDIRGMVKRTNPTGRLLFVDVEQIAFIRNGWLNPGAALPRSQLQPVIYTLRDNQLIRQHFYFPDVSLSAEPQERILLDKVSEMRMRFYLKPEPNADAQVRQRGGAWVESWNFPNALPHAIELTLETETWGRIERVFLINGGELKEKSIMVGPDPNNPGTNQGGAAPPQTEGGS